MIGVQRELKAAGKPYRSFEILNLGKYERQYFAGIDPTLPEKERSVLSAQKEEHYITLILMAYKAERVFQSPPFHGRKGDTFVVVGPLDAPVTRYQIEEAVDACRKLKASRLDVLGFEFEMGLSPQCVDEAKAKGVEPCAPLHPEGGVRQARGREEPGGVLRRGLCRGAADREGRKVAVKLKDFGVYYRQDDVDALVGEMKAGDQGDGRGRAGGEDHKDKNGIVNREVLTKKWTDWIDYWAVDFDFESRPEMIRGHAAGRDAASMGTAAVDRRLHLRERMAELPHAQGPQRWSWTSAPHEYAAKGRVQDRGEGDRHLRQRHHQGGGGDNLGRIEWRR